MREFVLLLLLIPETIQLLICNLPATRMPVFGVLKVIQVIFKIQLGWISTYYSSRPSTMYLTQPPSPRFADVMEPRKHLLPPSGLWNENNF